MPQDLKNAFPDCMSIIRCKEKLTDNDRGFAEGNLIFQQGHIHFESA